MNTDASAHSCLWDPQAVMWTQAAAEGRRPPLREAEDA